MGKQLRNLIVTMCLIVVSSLATSLAHASAIPETLQNQMMKLEQQGYRPWQWLDSRCWSCAVSFLPMSEELETRDVKVFMYTLATEKQNIQKLYRVDGQEYNLLAHMAIGILGRESQFFQSARYRFKETFPGIVRWAKDREAKKNGYRPTLSSRGPTQIKDIPDRIAEHYGVTPDNLYKPQNAAVATVGYLIEALAELRRRVALNDLEFVTESNYVDYLPYIYFGSRKKLINGTATPDTNRYVQEMKEYMSWVRVYEGPMMSESHPR